MQDLAEKLLAQGLDPSSIRNALMPLRAIFRRAVHRGDVAVNPTTGLELPAVRGRRLRVAAPDEATLLLNALPSDDQAVWATAFFAGLRRGELQALRWADVDLAKGLITVRRAWDEKSRIFAEPKSRAGRRKVPIAAVIRDFLDEKKLQSQEGELAFGTRLDAPFVSTTLRRRALNAWSAADLQPIGFHEARHTYASLMIAAGINPKALSVYMGHSSITLTLDRYGHHFPGKDEAAALLDAFLARAADSRGQLADAHVS